MVQQPEQAKPAPLQEAPKTEVSFVSLPNEPKPAQPKAAQSSPLPPKLVDSISIKSVAEVKVGPTKIQAEVKPLTEEDLTRYWHETAEELGLQDVMKNATVRVGEHVGRFEVDATTTYFVDEFRSHRIDVLEQMRKKTGMQMLDCRVNPLFVAQEEKVYSPDDKYNAMLEENRHLATLRKLFPEIDY